MDDATPPIRTEALLEHAVWLRGLARSLVADPSGADDVVQETWLAAIERPPRHAGRVRAWLAVVARNVVRLGHRTSFRRIRHEAAAVGPRPAEQAGARDPPDGHYLGFVRKVFRT